MPEILSKGFQERVAQELKITDLTIDNINNIPLEHFYFQLYIDYRYSLYKTEQILDTTYQELYNHYKFEYNKDLKSNEIILYIQADEKFKKVKSTLNKLKVIIEYLEGVVKMFANRSYHIKNALELEKLRNGG